MEKYRKEQKPPRFKYQLTFWLPSREDLAPFIQPFVSNNDHGRACIVESEDGFAIFTLGNKRVGLYGLRKREKEIV